MSYVSAVLADNPVHYWRLADPWPARVCHDIGSSPYHLLLGGSTVIPGMGYSGPASDGGSAFLYDDGIVASHDVVTSPAQFTLECWCWPFQLAQNGFLIAWDYDNNSVGMAILSSNKPWMSAGGGNVTGGTTVTVEQWHHMVATFSTTTCQLWWDGVSQGTFASANGTLTRAIGIGRTPNGTSPFRGALAEAAVYSGVLSNARIAAHFAAADNTSQAPVGNASGGGSAGGGGTNYTSLLNRILAAVQKTFPTT